MPTSATYIHTLLLHTDLEHLSAQFTVQLLGIASNFYQDFILLLQLILLLFYTLKSFKVLLNLTIP